MIEPAPGFWTRKTLLELTPAEWEALCDGCGRCCLHKLEDEESGLIYYTDVACRLLDLDTCRCRDYRQRRRVINDCVQLSPLEPANFAWLPTSCAYRCLAEGRSLPDWHYLVCGDREQVHRQGRRCAGGPSPSACVAIYARGSSIMDNVLLVTWPALSLRCVHDAFTMRSRCVHDEFTMS